MQSERMITCAVGKVSVGQELHVFVNMASPQKSLPKVSSLQGQVAGNVDD